MTRSISFWRPMTGSSLPCRARSVRSRPNESKAGVLDLLPFAVAPRSLFAASVHPVTEQVEHLLAHFFQLQVQVHQDLGGHALLLAQQAEQEVFGADVVVIEVARFLDRSTR